MKRTLLSILTILCFAFVGEAQDSAAAQKWAYNVTSYRAGTLNGGGWSSATWGREIPVQSSVILDFDNGKLSVLYPEAKSYRILGDLSPSIWKNDRHGWKYAYISIYDDELDDSGVLDLRLDKDQNLVEVYIIRARSVYKYQIEKQPVMQ